MGQERFAVMDDNSIDKRLLNIIRYANRVT